MSLLLSLGSEEVVRGFLNLVHAFHATQGPVLGLPQMAVVSTLVLVATMGLNAYSGMLTVVTALDSLKSVTTRRLRVVTILVLAAAWLLVSGGVYVALTRSLDVTRELALIASHPELADPASTADIAETVAEEEK